MKLARYLLKRRLRLRNTARRRFVHIVAGLLVAMPLLTVGQTSSTVVHRIGILIDGDPLAPDEISNSMESMRELGWFEGQNLYVERRYAHHRPEALDSLAQALVREKVELMVTGGTPATLAAKRATTTIPIVFDSAGDPVLLGLVASLARPGGNVTGFSQASPQVEMKQLALLKELLPGVRRIGVLESRTNPYFRALRAQFERSCQLLAIEPVFVEIATRDEIPAAIAQVARQGAQALVLRGGSLLENYRFEVTAGALKHRLPTLADDAHFVRQAGALISYSPNEAEQSRRAASLVDRVLRGAKPADLPVEQPTLFELLVNLKTANALGLTIPRSLLLRADEVIR